MGLIWEPNTLVSFLEIISPSIWFKIPYIANVLNMVTVLLSLEYFPLLQISIFIYSLLISLFSIPDLAPLLTRMQSL